MVRAELSHRTGPLRPRGWRCALPLVALWASVHAGLAVAEAHTALLVADNHQRGKAEPASALHHLGDAVDVDELIDELARLAVSATVAVAATLSSRFTCHS